MNKALIYVFESRPQFIILSVACVLVGAGSAYWKAGSINLIYLALALVGAMSAHASVNILNDYSDYKSGLDDMTPKTPFSGGSGILPKKLMSPRAALYYGLATLSVTVVIGLFLVYARGWELLLVGIPGVLMIVLYTDYITRSPMLCLLAPGLAFGPCIVLGTYFVLQGYYDITALAVSLIPFFFVSNLLLLNQFPDIEADRKVGRRHLLTLAAPRNNTYIYAVLITGAFLVLIASVYFKLLPLLTLIGLVSLPLAVTTIVGVIKNCENIPSLIPYLGRNVIVILSTLFLVALGLFVS
ncbi:prenyltransferase [Pelotomaculum propionicicum]|uniref:prenyltransferase n=1 Tax=Pelotomaculum propionicicum TaxID=258475 RepID=UPI003B77BEF5